jgi:hypothetical protein
VVPCPSPGQHSHMLLTIAYMLVDCRCYDAQTAQVAPSTLHIGAEGSGALLLGPLTAGGSRCSTSDASTSRPAYACRESHKRCREPPTACAKHRKGAHALRHVAASTPTDNHSAAGQRLACQDLS